MNPVSENPVSKNPVSKNAVFTSNSLGFALLLGAECVMPAPAPAQTPDQIRAICRDPALQQKLFAQVQGNQRVSLELQIEARCAQVDLPSTPVHDKADPSPAASHADWIRDARYSRDGGTIVSASRDGTVRLWEADTGKPIRRIVAAEDYQQDGKTRKGEVYSATFVGDGTRVAAAGTDTRVRLIDVAKGDILVTLPVAPGQLPGYPGAIARPPAACCSSVASRRTSRRSTGRRRPYAIVCPVTSRLPRPLRFWKPPISWRPPHRIRLLLPNCRRIHASCCGG